MSEKMRELFKKRRAALAGTLIQGDDWSSAFSKADEILSLSCFEAGWQASRETLVIEFPNRHDKKYQEYFDDVDGGCFNAAKYLADVKSTIEAAGLKVTPLSSPRSTGPTSSTRGRGDNKLPSQMVGKPTVECNEH